MLLYPCLADQPRKGRTILLRHNGLTSTSICVMCVWVVWAIKWARFGWYRLHVTRSRQQLHAAAGGMFGSLQLLLPPMLMLQHALLLPHCQLQAFLAGYMPVSVGSERGESMKYTLLKSGGSAHAMIS